MGQDEKAGQSGGKYFDDAASHFIFVKMRCREEK
jgi:hypothetical protein